jgi:uncharacterized oligopeptide transporter (OPT) family protein
MLAIGAVSSAAVMAPTLNVLAVSYGIGPRTADHLEEGLSQFGLSCEEFEIDHL